MRTTSASKRSITPAIRKADVPSPNMLFRQQGATRLGFSLTAIPRGSRREGSMGTANFGIAGLDWQQRINWDRMKKYRTERAREHMKKHGLGAMLCMIGSSLQCCAFASVAPIFRLPTGGIVRKYLTGG